jgi:NADP-dependent 3-hydroxy acid dehydrogenase YdfG
MNKPLVIITGASSGIGEAVAKEFAKAGHPLLLLARRLERLQALSLPNTMCEKVDVTDRQAFITAVNKAEAKYGLADCLVNNAGVMLLGQAHEQDPAEWDKMIDVNVKGVLAGIHAVLPQMIKREQGTIINISSIAGRKTFPNHAVYCGTKFAVHAMTENMREEAAQHQVRFITIAPGVVETELLGHTTSTEIKSDYQEWKKVVGKVLQPQDIAKAIMFAYQQPQYVCIREIVLAATRQAP